jgi:hypothetical protein
MSSQEESGAVGDQNKQIEPFLVEHFFRVADLLPFPWHASFAILCGAEGEQKLTVVDVVLSQFSVADCQPESQDRGCQRPRFHGPPGCGCHQRC